MRPHKRLAALLPVALLAAGCNKQIQPGDISSLPIVSSTFTVSGTVDTTVDLVVPAPNDGVLKDVTGREGMRVRSGQVLARLSNNDVLLRSDLCARKLAVLIARRQSILQNAGLAASPPAPVDHSADIAAAQSDVNLAASQLQSARQSLRDRTDLRAAVGLADNNVQAAQDALAASLAQVQAADREQPLETDRYQSVKRLYEGQAASREELRTANERLQAATATANTARAAYNRDLLALQAVQSADADARRRWRNPSDLKNLVLAAQARYIDSVAAYRRALQDARQPPAPAQAPPDLGSLDTDIVQAQADLAYAQQDVHHLEILAPITGTLSDWQGDDGENVITGQPLGHVVDLERLKVTCDVRPDDALYLLPGQAVLVIPGGPNQHPLKGKVSNINPSIDPNLGTQKVTISVFDGRHELVIGGEAVVRPVNPPAKGRKTGKRA